MASQSSSSGISTGLIVAGAIVLVLMILLVIGAGGLISFRSQAAPPEVRNAPAVAVDN